MVVLSRSYQQTEAIGRALGGLLERGTFLALYGDLGGGKTCFTRGVVAASTPESAGLVASPTYAIMNEYPGTVPVYHFDFYRLSGDDEVTELGFDEYFNGSGICIAEWSERLHDTLPPDRLDIIFEHGGDDCRKIRFDARGNRFEVLLTKLSRQLNSQEFL